jgi:predicted signal transduction protein with EAL and GGDEF domain
VIAEGVETEAQMTFLRAHHCDEIQGYYFSKPLPGEQVAEKLRSAQFGPYLPTAGLDQMVPASAAFGVLNERARP